MSRILSRDRAAPVGHRFPCSQLRMVSTETPIRRENSIWVRPRRFLIRRAYLAASCMASLSSVAFCRAISSSVVASTRSGSIRPSEARDTIPGSIAMRCFFILINLGRHRARLIFFNFTKNSTARSFATLRQCQGFEQIFGQRRAGSGPRRCNSEGAGNPVGGACGKDAADDMAAGWGGKVTQGREGRSMFRAWLRWPGPCCQLFEPGGRGSVQAGSWAVSSFIELIHRYRPLLSA